MASVWAIGDVHGENEKLDNLLAAIPRGADDYLVFLGDYIDRGPSTRKVVETALREYHAAPERTILLWGNHEDMAAGYFKKSNPTQYDYDPYDWFRNGGLNAMESWGFKPPEVFAADCPTELAELFTHLRIYFKGSDTGIPGMEPYLFVHAGILPGKTPEESTAETLLWVREEFLNSFDTSGRIVVHGHTPFPMVRVHPDKIGIDTGAVRGGPLTAIQLPERKLYEVFDDGKVIITDVPEFPANQV